MKFNLFCFPLCDLRCLCYFIDQINSAELEHAGKSSSSVILICFSQVSRHIEFNM